MLIGMLGVGAFAAAQHPFFTYPLSLAIASRFVRLTTVPVRDLPKMSVLCCCHNEEGVISEKVANLLECGSRYAGDVEYLFFLDNCSDGTELILTGFNSSVMLHRSEERVGKSVGMRTLAAYASGEVLIFTDANTFLALDALVELGGLFGPDIGGIAGSLSYTNPGETITSETNSLYWRYEELLKRLETQSGSTMGADGGLFAIRATLYKPTPPDIIDDLHTSMQIVLLGARLIFSPKVRAYEKTSTSRSDEFRRKVRIACRAFNAYRLLAHDIHADGIWTIYKFYSHRVLRWLCFPLIAFSAACLLLALLAARELYVSIGLCALASAVVILGRANIRLFSTFYEFLLSSYAVFKGVLQSMAGRRYQTWTPSSSGR